MIAEIFMLVLYFAVACFFLGVVGGVVEWAWKHYEIWRDGDEVDEG
jgi:hypothetical protein